MTRVVGSLSGVKSMRQYHPSIDFLLYMARRFQEDRALQTAAALSYTTVLAVVPLLTVMVYVLSAFPVFKSLNGMIHDFIFTNFLPTTGEVVQKYLEQFSQKAARLTTVGVLFLFVTALMVMDTIDQTLNDIWRIKVKRRRISSFMVYWAVLTLGPLLVGLSLAITSYLTSMPLFQDTVGGNLKSVLLGFLPFVFTVTAFTVLYTLVPNCPVRLRHALFGAVTAAVLFEIAKKGFAAYVTHVPTYAVIYGTLAAIPIFLIWIYISWVITLLGAELTYCAGHYHHERGQVAVDITGSELIAAFRIIGHLTLAQRQGDTLSATALLEREPNLDDSSLMPLLEALESSKLLHGTQDGNWSLSRDAAGLTLGDLYRAIPAAFPRTTDPWPGDDPWNAALAGVLSDANGTLDRALDIRLINLYDEPRRTTECASTAPDQSHSVAHHKHLSRSQ
jgi:membrane protein